MRRLVYGLSLGLVASSAMMLIAGCGGLSALTDLERLLPPGTFGSGSSSPFIGDFQLTSISVNGVSANCPGTASSGGATASCEATIRLFEANGNFLDTAPPDQIGSGTWSVTGSNITITKNNVQATYSVGFTPDQSQFVLTSGSQTLTWKRQG